VDAGPAVHARTVADDEGRDHELAGSQRDHVGTHLLQIPTNWWPMRVGFPTGFSPR
jgi:hypothetical protein